MSNELNLEELGLKFEPEEEKEAPEEFNLAGIMLEMVEAIVPDTPRARANIKKHLQQANQQTAGLLQLAVSDIKKQLILNRHKLVDDFARIDYTADRKLEDDFKRIEKQAEIDIKKREKLIRLNRASAIQLFDDSIKQEYKPEKVINQISDAEQKKAAARREMQLIALERENKKLIKQLNELKKDE